MKKHRESVCGMLHEFGVFLSETKEKVIPCRRAKDKKGVGTKHEKSGARNVEAESIRSRVESTGG